MRHLLLLLALVLPLTASAQTSPFAEGDILIGGNANLSANQSVLIANLQPSAQLFVNPKLAVGGTLGLTFVGSFNGGTPRASAFLGPEATYFFDPVKHQLIPYASGSASVAYASDLVGLGARVAAGGLLMLNDSVGFTGEAYYTAVAGSSLLHIVGLTFGISAFLR